LRPFEAAKSQMPKAKKCEKSLWIEKRYFWKEIPTAKNKSWRVKFRFSIRRLWVARSWVRKKKIFDEFLTNFFDFSSFPWTDVGPAARSQSDICGWLDHEREKKKIFDEFCCWHLWVAIDHEREKKKIFDENWGRLRPKKLWTYSNEKTWPWWPFWGCRCFMLQTFRPDFGIRVKQTWWMNLKLDGNFTLFRNFALNAGLWMFEAARRCGHLRLQNCERL
jgi:hypothetical protein